MRCFAVVVFIVMLVFVVGADPGEGAPGDFRGMFGNQAVVPGLNLTLSTNQST